MTDKKQKVSTNHKGYVNKSFDNDLLYSTNLLEMKVTLLMTQIGTGNMTKNNLQKTIKHFIEGKCVEEGYVQPGSVSINTYSSGSLKGERVEFHVIFSCNTYNPVEGSWINNCKVKSVTKAGIHANVFDSKHNIPANVFIIRDHFGTSDYFNKVREDDTVNVKVIGCRFELNDTCVEVLGNLMPSSQK